MKQLIVDAQIFHTPAFHRGMGKYSLELLSALIKLNKKTHTWSKVQLILSSELPLEDEVFSTIKKLLPEASIAKLPLQKDRIYDANSIMELNRKIIDQHIAKLPKPAIDFLILSPLQGGITSVFPSAPEVQKSLIFYDLIPFMFHQVYFRNSVAKMENLTKLGELIKADTFLAISKTVANDLSVYLGIDPARIFNIDGGPIKHGSDAKPLDIPRPFILMPTGNDLRKNNRIGILGFDEFNNRHGGRYSLVITSFFDPDQIKELSRLSDDVIFTGNVSGEELNYLYKTCDVLLFPSEYEGLGLPVLEAVEQNRPVACSDIAVFREISKTAFSYFDPLRATSIADALEMALTTPPDLKQYAKILDGYSWDRSADAAHKAMASFVVPDSGKRTARPNVVVVGANPECYNASARYVQRLHAELSKHVELAYFFEGVVGKVSPRPNMLDFIAPTASITKNVPIRLGEYDVAVYSIADTKESIKTLFAALANPGLVILHDLQLQTAWQTLRNEGLVSESRYGLEKEIDQKYAVDGAAMLGSLLASQKAVVVLEQKHKVIVQSVLEKMNLQTALKHLSFPTADLVYDETAPGKQDTVLTIGLQAEGTDILKESYADCTPLDLRLSPGQSDTVVPNTVNVTNDRELEDVIGRASAIVSQVGSENRYNALEGLRYDINVSIADRGGNVQNESADSQSYKAHALSLSKIINGIKDAA
ncbi:MAG: glycosyltransferase [Candidatus Saccharimonadales bacterium]